ncbi:hypothetical protein DL93DRAFT_740951 [Clavulina sp. PMI_390]|nr:hypothetical protein DL93DRAFT_740951 [Clavulina sp. PMI_390]
MTPLFAFIPPLFAGPFPLAPPVGADGVGKSSTSSSFKPIPTPKPIPRPMPIPNPPSPPPPTRFITSPSPLSSHPAPPASGDPPSPGCAEPGCPCPGSMSKHSGISVASSEIFSLMLSRRLRSTALCDSRRRRRFSLSIATLYVH